MVKPNARSVITVMQNVLALRVNSTEKEHRSSVGQHPLSSDGSLSIAVFVLTAGPYDASVRNGQGLSQEFSLGEFQAKLTVSAPSCFHGGNDTRI